MKKILFAVAFALFASTQAFAIFGAGMHYIMNTGSLESSRGNAQDIPGLGNIVVNQEKASGLKGLGFKIWVDFLPHVDIEGTFNVSATRYKTFLIVPTPAKDTIKLSYTPEAPYSMIFGDADPLYGVANGDLSITYPFDILPIIRPYLGAGISYFASIPVVNASFTKNMLDKSPELVNALKDPANADAASKVGEALAKTLKDESYTTGIGGHVIAGVRIKPPMVPIAVYANGKYYFGGNTNSQFSQGLVLELGGGFAL